MTRVLVTGGAGVLGQLVVTQLSAQPYAVRGTSRRERPAALLPGVEWASADLETGVGLAQALDGVDVIIHAASSALQHSQQVNVDGTQRLLALAHEAGVAHMVYISIVGVERIPFPYYQHKLIAEGKIMRGGVPWTILRATQFHDLLDRFIHNWLQTRSPLPVAFAPLNFKYQLVDAGEVAAALCDCVAAGPRGNVPDMGGPRVQTVGELIHAWLAVRQRRRLVLPMLRADGFARAMRRGDATCPYNRQGKITWDEWLARRYSSATNSSKTGLSTP